MSESTTLVSAYRLCLAAVACVTTMFTAVAQPDCPPLLPPTYIYGESGWYAEGDTIQFIGESYGSCPANGCGAFGYSWTNCPLDFGWAFRKVTDVDLQTCSCTPNDTCEAFAVSCCVFWSDNYVCSGCGVCCGDENRCQSFWEVAEFHLDGDTGRGCYELNYVADCSAEDCENVDVCETVRSMCD